MDFECIPEPSAEERAAIRAALEAEEAEQPASSPWTDGVLPRREPAGDPDP